MKNTIERIMIIRNNLSKDAEQFLFYILRDGFDQDFVGLEVGTNSSNEGDGAEHLFVAKAMIAITQNDSSQTIFESNEILEMNSSIN